MQNLKLEGETTLYKRFIGKAIRYRDMAKEEDISPEIKASRLEMMRMYASLARAGGLKGSIYK